MLAVKNVDIKKISFTIIKILKYLRIYLIGKIQVLGE